MTRFIFSVPVFLTLIAAAPAAAVDFTINIPVTLENMPAARRVEVNCTAQRTADGSTEPGSIVGSGSGSAAVSDGRFSGTITVAFNASASAPPGLARSYSCIIMVHGIASDGRAFFSSYNGLADAWVAATGQRITVEPTWVSGRLVP
ncbi:MAG: hypothetical protein A3F90_00685 [Deltaproteobacteria bacterium RIFCSPLOWO2_12_FULL_60_19]|nr:MAG: hypothetical protein A3F90_00685 [Deltaproteobacteria bacterium RIFCSPLOWO2_12_FULL_60_19]